ncbi:hypothetical protein JCM19298_3265 [Nonlabens ulvanivorans]|nr:hypothetical protein [Nonlabens ulvanivorans]GAK88539.1 hypothetical protein JCM19297_3052 [Nonlabens ulvanivorans]GAK92777.1 hypothetical protein JCM19298_3265 [Nonlabens ulvanivorans]
MALLHKYPIVKRSFYLSIVLVFAFAKAQSQRNSSHIIYANSGITTIDIFLESTIELEIIATKEDQVKIIESQGGEYRSAVLLNTEISNDTLKITDPFNPSFSFPQDKLSAHKVIDGKATIYVPENLILDINSRNCYLTINGNFKFSFINLESGSCLLKNVRGDFHIVSVNAMVVVTNPSSYIEMSSKYGVITQIVNEPIIYYNQKIETINSNITIKD